MQRYSPTPSSGSGGGTDVVSGGVPPDQLSPQEKAVARLAQAGRTNRRISRELYLSVNTVETRLAHTYRKLGIHRRSQLTGQDLN